EGRNDLLSLEEFQHLLMAGIRDLEAADREALEVTRQSARSSLRTLTSTRGDKVSLQDEKQEQGLHSLGFDEMVFYAAQGGFMTKLTVLGEEFEIVFDQNYRLAAVQRYGPEQWDKAFVEKVEAILLEYVKDIRTNT